MILLYLISLFIAPQLWIEPFVGLRVDLFIYPLWMLVLLTNGKFNDIFRLNKQDLMFLFFIGWVILSSVFNTENASTTTIIFEYVKWFFLYRMVSLTIEGDEAFIKTVHKMIFIIFIIAIEAIQHKYFSPDGIGWAGQTLGWVDQSVIDAGGTGRTRWINIFDGPGVFVVMFTLILPFLLQFQDKVFSLKIRFFSLFLIIPVLLAIWTTGSRGGFLATLAIFALYGLTRMNISTTRAIKIGALLSMVYMLAPSYLTSTHDAENSAQHRVDMWMEGIEMVQQNPLFGIGSGNFAEYTGLLIAHNSAIEIMGETGFPGLFFWVANLYLAFKTIFIAIKNTSNNRVKSYYKGLAICIAGYIVNSMFVTLEYETLYFILAMARSFDKDNELEFTQTDVKRVLFIVIGFFIALRIFVKLYY